MAARYPELILIIGSVLLYLYYYCTKTFNFWKKLGIPGPKPIPFFGNFKDVMLGKIHQSEYIKYIYNAYPNEPAIGLYQGRVPVLLLKDLDVIKDVLIKRFDNFVDRGLKAYKDLDPLSQSLIFAEPKEWKPLRKNLSPVFTSAKLKDMFYLMNDCADHFNQYIQKSACTGAPVECRELTAKFTTDVISICAFGLHTNSLSEQDNDFRKMGRKVTEASWFNTIRRSARSLPHWMVRLINFIIGYHEVSDFFITTVTGNVEYRKKNNVRRNDFIDQLIDIRNNAEIDMSDIPMTAQAYVFFIAGFETSSAVMSHAMYELALNPDVQDKLREEVNATYAANDGKLSYNGMNSITYLDKVVKEVLRKYCPVLTLQRRAANDHVFTDTKIFIPKGTLVMVPINALHYDPKYYHDPDKFCPERFDKDAAKSSNQMSFLPFSDGPRNCIGERFANAQIKVGLAMIIKNYKLEVCEKTAQTYKMNPATILLVPIGGLYVKLKKI